MKSSSLVVMLAAAGALWSSDANAGTNAPTASPAARPVPAATMSVGSLTVEKYGSGDPAVILIPGLACGSWVWDGTINALEAKHTVYALTLAGFDGTQPTKAPMLDAADASIQKLIDTEHLAKPVIVGHSLGGFLAIRFAEEHSEELSRAVAIDGLPVFPTMAQMPSDQRQAVAKQISAQLRSATPEQFAAMEKETIAGMVTDPSAAAHVAALAAKSDPSATAEYAQEMFAADLRPGLGSIHVPLMEIVPVPKVLPPGYPDSLRSLTPVQLKDTFVSFDKALFPGASTLQVVPIPDARHFAMIDQPDTLNATLEAFVDGTK